jgi:DHA2 family multidrug resistance protein
LVTTRQQFHSNRVGEAVSLYEPAVVERLDRLGQQLQTAGLDPVAAADGAIKLIDASVRRDSFVMAYNDAFLILGLALLACVAFVWMGKKVLGGGAGDAH